MRVRRLVIVGVLILALVVGGGYCLSNLPSSIKQGSPEAVAKGAILALETKDADKVTAYFTPIPGRLMTTRLTSTFQFDSVKIQDLVVHTILNEVSSARVQAVYDMVVTKDGVVNVQHCNKVLKLVKIDGKWWINEPF